MQLYCNKNYIAVYMMSLMALACHNYALGMILHSLLMFVKTGKCTLLYKSKSSAHEIAILSGYSIAVEYSGPDRAPIAAEIDAAGGNRRQRSSVRARVRGGVLYPLYSHKLQRPIA